MAKRFLLSSVARLTRQSAPAAVSSTRHLWTIAGNTATTVRASRLSVPATTPLLVRYFETEAAYSNVADQTLETIQDTIDEVLDELPAVEYEVSYASGVLTFSLPGHGTWVLNKQTPNQQIWWSSPLSGPKRFEYDPNDKLWFSTKDGLNLGRSLVQEIHHTHPEVPDFELNV